MEQTPLAVPLDPWTYPLLTLHPFHHCGKRVLFVRTPKVSQSTVESRPTLAQVLGHLKILQGKDDHWVFWELSLSSPSILHTYDRDLSSQVITLRFPSIGLCSLTSIKSFLASLLWWLNADPTHLAILLYDEARPEFLLVLVALLCCFAPPQASLQDILEMLKSRDEVGESDFHWFANFLGSKGTLGYIPIHRWLPSCRRYAEYLYHLETSPKQIYLQAYRLCGIEIEGPDSMPIVEVYHRLPAPLADGRSIPIDTAARNREWFNLIYAVNAGNSVGDNAVDESGSEVHAG